MRTGIRRALSALCLAAATICGLIAFQPAPAAEAAKQSPADSMVVLDTASVWRMHQTLEAPVIQFDDGIKPALDRQEFMNFRSPPPPAGWTARDFDDGNWVSALPRMASRTPLLSRLCLRGKFLVTDPAKAAGLSMSVQYYGGAIVYVNGAEVGRANVSAGANLADPYPAEAFVRNGLYVGNIGRGLISFRPEDGNLHLRKLENVAIPARLLTAGVNVVCVELLRAPYHKIIDEVKPTPQQACNDLAHQFTWNTCDIWDVRLTCAREGAVRSSAVRPPGFQVWDGDVLACDTDQDFANPVETLRPVTIAGARNGSFSGKVVVGSTSAIAGLHVTPSDLKSISGKGSIAAAEVQIRYGMPWGHESLTEEDYTPQELPYPSVAYSLSMLADEPPPTAPVRKAEVLSYGKYLRRPGQPAPVPGAVVPVWITVHVPKGAEAGAYVGKVTIQARGEKAVEAPVHLSVADWTLPDPANYRTWVDLMQSPDTLVQEYGVKMWSEKHFDLIGRSMRLIAPTGSGVVYVPLIAHTNLGNEESMVRWIKKGDGYTHDLSPMEKYLDAAEKDLGKPKMVIFYVWDVFLIADRPKGDLIRYGRGRNADQLAARQDQGPPVTVLDPATGATSLVYLPPYTAPQSKALWKPLFDEIHKGLAKRGLSQAAMLGLFQDAWASKGEVQFFKELAPTFPWAIHSHGNIPADRTVFGVQAIGYDARYYQCRFADMSGGKTTAATSLFGWKQKDLVARFDREQDLDTATATLWRHRGETNITGAQRGVGRIGADNWPSIKDKNGNRAARVFNRYPESTWGGLNMVSSALAPGPDGALATNRFLNFQEGVQECEARIAVERALSDPALKQKLGDELARRAQKLLDERLLCIFRGMSHLQMTGPVGLGWLGKGGVSGPIWFRGSSWQQRSYDLFALASEVTKKLSG